MVVSIEFDRLIRTWWCTNAHPGLQWVSSTNILVVMKGLMISMPLCIQFLGWWWVESYFVCDSDGVSHAEHWWYWWWHWQLVASDDDTWSFYPTNQADQTMIQANNIQHECVCIVSVIRTVGLVVAIATYRHTFSGGLNTARDPLPSLHCDAHVSWNLLVCNQFLKWWDIRQSPWTNSSVRQRIV